jgi:S1-C subfamily serine protease
MQKFLTIFLLILFSMSGCAHVRHGSVKKSLDKVYYSSVSIVNKNNRSFGSGTIIHNGAGEYMTVLTAEHVVDGMKKRGSNDIYVFVPYDGLSRKVTVYRIDKSLDLAILISTIKETSNGPYVKLARNSPNIGDKVYAIGSPLGDRNTVTDGIISNFENKAAKRAKTNGSKKLKKLTDKKEAMHYRLTAPIFFGNSGGGLFNDRSELIGVVVSMQYLRLNFAILAVSGAGFAVSLETIREFM